MYAALLLLLPVLAAGGYRLHQANQAMAQVEADLYAVVTAQAWTRANSPDVLPALIEPAADPAWRRAVLDAEWAASAGQVTM